MVGRLRIQIFGFLGVGALFMVSAGAYGPLTTKGGIGTFQFIYFFSSFVVSRPLPAELKVFLRVALPGTCMCLQLCGEPPLLGRAEGCSSELLC